jgi:hypothetical protein
MIMLVSGTTPTVASTILSPHSAAQSSAARS